MEVTLEELKQSVRNMRKFQKRFFKSAIGSGERKEALGYSKHWEGIVDRMVAPPQEIQLVIFEEAESADP